MQLEVGHTNDALASVPVLECADYRLLLKEELEQRVVRNPRYSLRGFARDLEMSGSQLSDVLNGKQGLSLSRAKKIVKLLKWPSPKGDLFCDLVEYQHARSAARRRLAYERLEKCLGRPKLNFLSDVQWNLLKDWIYLAVLELTRTDDFVSDSKWIADRLKQPIEIVDETVQCLILHGYLKVEEGRWMDSSGGTISTSGISNDNVKKFQKAMLHTANLAMEDKCKNPREFQSVLLAVDPENMAAAAEKIRRFVEELTLFMSTGSKTEVYSLNIQLFNLTHAKAESAVLEN